jgi:hypothetical protein
MGGLGMRKASFVPVDQRGEGIRAGSWIGFFFTW